jgi:predicted DNA binding CopG/RHH family protein
MEKEFKIPDFKTEAEEASWWAQNQVRLARAFRSAAAKGRLNRGTLVRKGITPTTTIRLDPSDIERAKTQAERRGLKYQTYLKMLIHEALRSEEQKAG